MVQRRRDAGRAGGLLPGARLHGHPAARLPLVGADAAGPGRHVQGDGPPERVLPAVHSDELSREGSRARGGLRERGRAGDAHPAQGYRQTGRAGRDARSRVGVGGAARGAAHVRNDHLRDVRQVDPELPRPAAPDEPVVQHRTVGAPDAVVPPHHGVSVAGRAHGACHRAGGRGGGAADARSVSHVPGAMDGDARDHRTEDRQREIRGRAAHLCPRSADAGQQGVAGGDVAQPRSELRQGVQRAVPDRGGRARVRVEHLVGRDDPHDRRPRDDALGRQRTGLPTEARADTGGDRADLEIR